MFFKTPSLRNIEKTAPYLHDGSVASLEETVHLMAEYQLAKKLSDAEVASIVTWLKSLTGELPLDFIRKPELPASTAQTPKPDLTE
jgi:cytochrome c peroxidase